MSEIVLIGYCELRRAGCQRRWRCQRCECWGAPGLDAAEALAQIRQHHLADCVAVERATRGQAAYGRRPRGPVAVRLVEVVP